MGWVIKLVDANGQVCQVPRHSNGSNVNLAAPEITAAEIDVTFNYKKLFNFSLLDGNKAAYSRRIIRDFVFSFRGKIPSKDYWEATEGNVKKILYLLFYWAGKHPNAIWRVY